MASLRNPDSATKHKNMYKLGSPPTWKDTYKRRCTDRLKSSRSKLLQKFRNITVETETNATDEADSSIVDDVMREEWNALQSEKGDLIFDSVLATLEEIKNELVLQEQEILVQYEKDREHEEEALHSAVSHHENQCQNQIVCPICKSNYLEIKQNVIFCKCGLHVDTEQDCITLRHVDIQLRVGSTSHLEKCHARPVFGVVDTFGTKNLLMSCNACDFMFIVI